jgi:hypothetical protein
MHFGVAEAVVGVHDELRAVVGILTPKALSNLSPGLLQPWVTSIKFLQL